jgi:hypothetical protein
VPSVILPPLLRWALAAIGGAAMAHWALREMRRVNEELDRVKAAPPMDPTARQQLPTLKRDPVTGEWRLV